MAAGQFLKLRVSVSRLCCSAALRNPQIRQKHSRPPLDDPNCEAQIGVTADGQTVVCYHPTADVPYELTQPVGRPDPVTSAAETHEQVLKSHLSREVLQNNKGPTIEELSQMFFTTKHRWYPVGQYHTRRRKKDPPKDR